jgi:hypothetical protein
MAQANPNSDLTLSPFYLRAITARHVRFTPKERTCAVQLEMSALCQKRTLTTCQVLLLLQASAAFR